MTCRPVAATQCRKSMDNALRLAWTELISAADLDDHKHQVGQVAANAELLQSMLVSSAREKSVGLLIAGAGTAQFLDYIPATCLAPFHLTLSDINESFLRRAKERCHRGRCKPSPTSPIRFWSLPSN